MRSLYGLSWCLMLGAARALAADSSGAYVEEGNPSITLFVGETSDGGVSGSFEAPGRAFPFTARRKGEQFVGTVGQGADALPFQVSTAGDRIVFEITQPGDEERHVFRRTGAAPAVAAPSPAPPPRTKPATSGGNGRNVFVNDVRLSDADLARIEQAYRVRIIDANYWYDRATGAWGIKGGQTRGFILPGLPIGGELKADASGGGTHVFINGRELHPLDVAGLQRCTQVVLPGRYWVGADGTGGREGGPPYFNLVALCAPKGGSGAGGAGGWVCDGQSCGSVNTRTGVTGVV